MFAFAEVQEGNSISPPYLEFAYEFVCLRKIQPRIDWTVACLYEKEEINTHTKKKKKENKKGLQSNQFQPKTKTSIRHCLGYCHAQPNQHSAMK